MSEPKPTKAKKTTWRLVSLLGSWHRVSAHKAFRFYLRENNHGEQWYFADYRIDDLTSRFHEIGPFSDGLETCNRRVNTAILEMDREQLANL